ncbi:MAG TPA: glutamate racemase [Clostridiales bacterium]|jgi:glutamate racemase|nr:glutamate racemase [Clostridiales bacterium]
MDNRPIGFFDSGLGGLTCIAPFTATLPDERIIYFGDTARTPYGSKAVSTIRSFSFEIADFLVQSGVKMIVIACNTVSSTCLYDLRARYPELPVLGIIRPAAIAAAAEGRAGKKIGVIGTKVTVRSGAYEKQIRELQSGLTISSVACPALVPLIEEGILENNIMDLTVRHYLDDFISSQSIDTLVLGCTHYPLIRTNIEKLYPKLEIIDPSQEIVNSICRTLTENELAAGPNIAGKDGQGATQKPDHTFYASDLSENFINMIDRIFAGTGFQMAFKSFDLDIGK